MNRPPYDERPIELVSKELMMPTDDSGTAIRLERAIPILRMFDEAKAREFYLDFLGFSIEFEHRYEADLPLSLIHI